jgi:hypothetical protein
MEVGAHVGIEGREVEAQEASRAGFEGEMPVHIGHVRDPGGNRVSPRPSPVSDAISAPAPRPCPPLSAKDAVRGLLFLKTHLRIVCSPPTALPDTAESDCLTRTPHRPDLGCDCADGTRPRVAQIDLPHPGPASRRRARGMINAPTRHSVRGEQPGKFRTPHPSSCMASQRRRAVLHSLCIGHCTGMIQLQRAGHNLDPCER